MIPEQSYPEMGKLFRGVPQLFKHSEIVGIFLGDELCASLMHSSDQLDKIVFYENFTSVPSVEYQKQLTQLYKGWEDSIPNLTVSLTDGKNFNTTADYIHHDMDVPLNKFFETYHTQLQHCLLSNCGFGGTIGHTLDYCWFINKKVLFPVLLHRDILFYTFNKSKADEIFEIMHNFLVSSDLVFDLDDYYFGKVLKIHTVGGYDDRLDQLMTDK